MATGALLAALVAFVLALFVLHQRAQPPVGESQRADCRAQVAARIGPDAQVQDAGSVGRDAQGRPVWRGTAGLPAWTGGGGVGRYTCTALPDGTVRVELSR